MIPTNSSKSGQTPLSEPSKLEMFRQALGLRETVLGKEHPVTLTGMNNLAVALRDQGKYEQVAANTRAERDGAGQRAS
jgi:hypothetical protein